MVEKLDFRDDSQRNVVNQRGWSLKTSRNSAGFDFFSEEDDEENWNTGAEFSWMV